MPPTSEDSGRHGTPTLDATTRVKLTLAQSAMIVSTLVTLLVGAVSLWLHSEAHIDNLDAALQRHMADQGVHLSPNFQMAHGAPVGAFDFRETLSALTEEINELKRRPFVLDGETCRQVKGGTLCQQK
jgi:hypothetical protein